MSLFGPPNVEDLKAKRDVKGLIKALGYRRNIAIRMDAAKALGELKDVQTVKPLVAALNDSYPRVRDRAAEALGKIGDVRAIEPLITTLHDNSDSDVCKAAADALAQIGTPAVEPLIAEFRNSMRRAAADALGKIGDVRAVEPLITALNKDSNSKGNAASALGEIGDVRAVEPLIAALNAALKDRDAYMCERATEALGKIGDARAVEPLIAVLNSTFKDRKEAGPIVLQEIYDARCVMAAEALGQIGDARAVEPLIAVLAYILGAAPRAAAEALGKIGDTRAVEPLITALKYFERIRPKAAEALGKIGDARAVEPLIAALTDHDSDVRQAAAEALRIISGSGSQQIIAEREKEVQVRLQIEALLNQIQDVSVKKETIEKLRDISTGIRGVGLRSEIRGTLVRIANDDRNWDRMYAAIAAVESLDKAWSQNFSNLNPANPEDARLLKQALGNESTVGAAVDALIKMGATAAPLLVDALQSPNAIVRRYAASALGTIASEQAIDPLVAALNDSDRKVEDNAAEALEKIGAPAVDALIKALQHGSRNVRGDAAHVLGCIKDIRAIDPLTKALSDSEVYVHQEAEKALIHIGKPAIKS